MAELEIGDSFLVPLNDIKTRAALRAAVYHGANARGIRVSVRFFPAIGMRVWRIE